MAEHGVPGWWAQGVTVEYEKARGLRPIGGDRDGTYNVTASKTSPSRSSGCSRRGATSSSASAGSGDVDLHERTSTPTARRALRLGAAARRA